MTRPDFMAEAAEIVRIAKQFGDEGAFLIAMKLELAYEAGRGAGIDETNETLIAALERLGRKPS